MPDGDNGPVAQLVDALIAWAATRRARFIAIEDGSVRIWIDGEWHHELALPVLGYLQIVRRLGVLIGVLPPARDRSLARRLIRTVGDSTYYCRVLLDHQQLLSALVELVTAAELAQQPRPMLPTQHPYRPR